MKTRTKVLNPVIVLMVGLFCSIVSNGQSPADSLAMEDDQIITAIAPYPADMRAAILDVAQYPQALVKLERLQARSSQSFQDLVEPLPREEQEKLYQASRFPATVTQLVMTGRQHPDRVNAFLKDFPDQLQKQLLDVYNNHYEELMKMDRIYQSSQGAVQTLTDKYPKSVQENFNKILANPDVMTLLTDHINLTLSLGDAYKSDPSGVTQQLDQMNKQLTDQSDKDLNAYKETVAKDPKLQEEMKGAANEYAEENNQSEVNPNYIANSTYDNYPYPYWFGYPSWYGSPMWYPLPFYYQTGFYYGPGGGMVIVGMPSMGYSNWFFRRGYLRYPGLYNCYNSYYNLHPRGIANVYRGFNTPARNFYNYRNSGSNYRYNSNRGRSSYGQGRDGYSGSRTTQSSGSRMNQMNLRQGNFNSQGVQRYHATTYHNMGWRSMSGGGRGFSGGGPVLAAAAEEDLVEEEEEGDDNLWGFSYHFV